MAEGLGGEWGARRPGAEGQDAPLERRWGRELQEATMMIRVGFRLVTDDGPAFGMAGPAGEWARPAPAPRVWVFVEGADPSCDVEWVGEWATAGRCIVCGAEAAEQFVWAWV